MKKIIFLLIVLVTVSGCAATRTIKHTCKGEGDFKIEAGGAI
jgi:uncharacterized protein YceK